MTVSGQNELSYLGVRATNPPNEVIADRAPVSTAGGDYQFPIGTIWVDKTGGAAYILVSVLGTTGSWDEIGAGVGVVATVNHLNPVAGDIEIAGTAAQIAVANAGNTVTLSLTGPYAPASYTAHGVLVGEGAGSIVATAAGTTGQVLIGATGADPAFGALGVNSGLTSHGVLLGENNSAIAATAAGTTGQVLIGATGADPAFGALGVNSGLTAHGVLVGEGNSAIVATAVGATGTLLAGTTGADPSFTGSPSVTGSVTAGTTLTATLGAITATNGNLVLGTAGNKIVSSSVGTTTAAGANSFGSVTLVGGTATVATTAVTASSLIVLWRQSLGATGANPIGLLYVGTITANTSFEIHAGTTASATTDVATDVSVVGWMIIN